MPWPEHISEKFERVQADPNPRVRENHWYAVWLTLLSKHFPPVEHWSIYPQWSVPMNLEPSQVPGGAKGLVNFTVTFVIQKHKVTVFILKIKPAYWLTSASSRIRADIQMFNRFSSIWDNKHLLPIDQTTVLLRDFAEAIERQRRFHDPQFLARCSKEAPPYSVLSKHARIWKDGSTPHKVLPPTHGTPVML